MYKVLFENFLVNSETAMLMRDTWAWPLGVFVLMVIGRLFLNCAGRRPALPSSFPSEHLGTQQLTQTLERVAQTLEGRLEHLEQTVAQLNRGPQDDSSTSTATSVVDTFLDAMQRAMTLQTETLGRELGQLSVKVTTALAEGNKNTVGPQWEQLKSLMEKTVEACKKAAEAKGTDPKQTESVLQALQNAGKLEQSRFGTLDKEIKGKIDTTCGELCNKIQTLSQEFHTLMTRHEEGHARLDFLSAKIEGLLANFEPLPEKVTKQCDRIEALLRERTSSLQEDINRLMGSSGQRHRDEVSCQRATTKALESVQAALADMGGAFSRPPVDSEGVSSLLNTISGIEETLQELCNTMQEIKDRGPLPERGPLPRASSNPPALHAGAGQAQDPYPGGSVGASPPTMPTVVDLSRCLPIGPRPVHLSPAMSGLAAVTFSNGRTMLTPEDEFIGYPATQLPTTSFRRH